MRKRRDDPASRPDEENPEWTAEDFAKARPALDVIGETFGVKAADALRRRVGRPVKPDRKVNQTLRLDADVLAAYRGLGAGWQAHMNRVLREHMPGREK
jgi:uncharacterized protein (DUF4415 family)